MKVTVQVPGVVGLTACGIVPLFIETTVPEMDGGPPAQVVERLFGDANVALPPMLAISSVNDVMLAASVTDVFCNVAVTVEV